MTNISSDPNDRTIMNNELQSYDNNEMHMLQIRQIEDKVEKEKELFQKEMFHRFKNNLQVITSLLNIQSSYVKDEESRQMFINSTERVKTIAMIYDKLYQTENMNLIYFDRYLKDLVNYTIKNFDSNTNFVKSDISTIEVILHVKTALSCGLIINELVSNSLKHAFKDHRNGIIKINLEHLTNEYILTVEDNGSGLPEDFNIDTTDSLGLMLVKSLSDQINGTLELIGINGTKFVLKFPENGELK